MKPFEEKLRYEYDLTPDSLVYDVGAYQGSWAREIHRKYGCRVLCFEPVFHKKLTKNLGDLFPSVKVFPFGVGDCNALVEMGVKGDMTGAFEHGNYKVMADVRDVSEVLVDDGFIFKLNCEGSEFSILEAVLERGLATKLRNIQVQPHAVVPNAEKRWAAIQAGLLKTHHLTFNAPWCWQNYEFNA